MPRCFRCRPNSPKTRSWPPSSGGRTVALTERALCEFCQPRLAYFAVPRFIEFVDELPMTENGKVQKYKLRDRGVTAKAWDREARGSADQALERRGRPDMTA